MKAVLMSIRPTWAQAIDRGQKTVEVRKTFPNFKKDVSCPFKVYLYCTQGKRSLITILRDGDENYGEIYHGKPVFITLPEGGYGSRVERGTVFGEFICDCAEVLNEPFVDDSPLSTVYHLPFNGESLLTVDYLEKYGNKKRLWGWHISEYKWYREPKSLADFWLKRPPQSWCYVDEITLCNGCVHFSEESIVLPTGEHIGVCKMNDSERFCTCSCEKGVKRENT